MRYLFHPCRVLIALAVLALNGCSDGSGDGDGQARIRLLNVSPGYSSLDLYVEDDDGNDSIQNSAVASGSVSDYAVLDSGTYTVKLKRQGITSTLLTLSDRALADESHAVYVAYGSSGHFGVMELTEDEAEPDSGDAKIKVLNTAEAGSLNVYLTESSVSLEDASPVFSAIGSGSSTNFTTIDSGDYRLRITGSSDTGDLRLDVPNITLQSEQVLSLVLTATTGGVLVNALVLTQQGSPTEYDTTKARVRGAVGIANGTIVTARVGGVGVLSNAAIGVVGNYQQVEAGNAAITLSVDGNAVSVADQALTAGSEYTLLVWSDANGATTSLISDDNRLPSTSGKTKIRVMNGVSSQGVPVTLAVDYSPTAEGIAVGLASSFTEVVGGQEYQLDISNTNTGAPLYSRSSVSLQGDSVYTLFAFPSGGNVGGTLRKDR